VPNSVPGAVNLRGRFWEIRGSGKKVSTNDTVTRTDHLKSTTDFLFPDFAVLSRHYSQLLFIDLHQ
jgi:hypothetical protein